MTIVVTVRVNDGIVLAADSATSFSDSNGNIAKVYNNANKIFNLVKGWPVGAMTYGAGSIGSASISTLSKDLRKHLTPTERPDPLALDRDAYTIEQVAERARDFLRGAYQGLRSAIAPERARMPMPRRVPSREEAKPRRAKSRPGPIPTLGEFARQASWVHAYCEARDCHHSAPLKLADAIARYGEQASSDVLRTKTNCTACGARVARPSGCRAGSTR